MYLLYKPISVTYRDRGNRTVGQKITRLLGSEKGSMKYLNFSYRCYKHGDRLLFFFFFFENHFFYHLSDCELNVRLLPQPMYVLLHCRTTVSVSGSIEAFTQLKLSEFLPEGLQNYKKNTLSYPQSKVKKKRTLAVAEQAIF